MRTKRCYKCGGKKTLEEFCRNKAKKDGRNHQCKICQNANARARYTKDPEKIRAQKRTHYAKNHDEIRAREKARRGKDYEKIRAQERLSEVKPQNRERKNAREKARRTAYSEKINTSKRTRRAKNLGKYRAQERKSYHKIKGGMIVFELMIAANIIQSEFVKGIEDGNKSINNPKRKPV